MLQLNYTWCKELKCFIEPEYQDNAHTDLVHLKDTNQKLKVIEHILDSLVKVVQGIMLDWKVLQVIVKINGRLTGKMELRFFAFCCFNEIKSSNNFNNLQQINFS